ncbi:MAG TPA: quinone oxidoreductase [Polyangia bacterium]|jgi:NADPH2:quinone reductase|nr:quinone oxidoreductase [Polyangia bacterium]
MKALTFDRFGGPEVLTYREVSDPVFPPDPGPGYALVRTQAIGLNFADIYRRRGNYHLQGAPPYIAGYEAAGVIEALAPGSAAAPPSVGQVPPFDFRVGQRVAFADSPFANAERVVVPLAKLIPLPDDISAETGAALFLQGLTAQYLVRDSHPLRPGETAIVHAAAGGVGLLLVQICKLLGARVLGLVSSAAKAEAAQAAGADLVARYDEDWVAAALSWAPGGVDVVYDSVGSTLMDSFRAAGIGKRVVFYGMAGGNPPLVDPRMLMDTSKTLTGGDLWNVLGDFADRQRRAGELLDWVRSGRLTVRIAASFPLSRGADAHRLLEGRGVIGKVLLLTDA